MYTHTHIYIHTWESKCLIIFLVLCYRFNSLNFRSRIVVQNSQSCRCTELSSMFALKSYSKGLHWLSSNHDTALLPLLDHFDSLTRQFAFVWVIYWHPSKRIPVLCFHFKFAILPGLCSSYGCLLPLLQPAPAASRRWQAPALLRRRGGICCRSLAGACRGCPWSCSCPRGWWTY